MNYLKKNQELWNKGRYEAPNVENFIFRFYGRILKFDYGIDGSNAFLLNIEDYDTTEVEDYSDEDQYSGVTGWADYKDTVAGTVKVDVNDADTYPSGQFWIHITGQTGVTSFNGVKLATRVDGDEF